LKAEERIYQLDCAQHEGVLQDECSLAYGDLGMECSNVYEHFIEQNKYVPQNLDIF
jgi:hypothetical protein